jgi:hypothetical protein
MKLKKKAKSYDLAFHETSQESYSQHYQYYTDASTEFKVALGRIAFAAKASSAK